MVLITGSWQFVEWLCLFGKQRVHQDDEQWKPDLNSEDTDKARGSRKGQSQHSVRITKMLVTVLEA